MEKKIVLRLKRPDIFYCLPKKCCPGKKAIFFKSFPRPLRRTQNFYVRPCECDSSRFPSVVWPVSSRIASARPVRFGLDEPKRTRWDVANTLQSEADWYICVRKRAIRVSYSTILAKRIYAHVYSVRSETSDYYGPSNGSEIFCCAPVLIHCQSFVNSELPIRPLWSRCP